MPIEHLSPDAGPERVAEVLRRDACVVVDRLASPEQVARIRREMQPWLEKTPTGPDAFAGHRTRRCGGLIPRSPTARELIAHPTALETTRQLLTGATSFQLHLTQIIAIGPGERAQPIHRDQWAFDFFPFPPGYEAQCNTIWALTDFTEENGATRVVPGSHRFEDKLEIRPEDTEPAEMEAGAALFYTGAIYHGGGANRSSEVRVGLNITYARSWLRQEENQYLTTPREVARELPVSLLRLMGYARGAYALGYVDDLRDPLSALEVEAEPDGLGDLERAAAQARGEA